jgi:cell division protein FtsI/penicillin-binding protein 2
MQYDRGKRLRRRLFWRRVVLLAGLIGVAGAVIAGIENDAVMKLFSADANIRWGGYWGKSAPLLEPMDKRQLSHILNDTVVMNLESAGFEWVYNGAELTVQTSLDMDLQRFLMDHIDPSHALYIGIVAMEPSTGRILAMVGYDKNNPANNPCTATLLPAASIFKIITATAAVEAQRFSPDATLTYTGNKYTLYHSQIQDRPAKHSNKISLKDSFAQSVNPVFGKLGALHLKKDRLDAYARAFGFNRSIDLEIGLSPSSVSITDDPYELAEVASGFNRQTSITPVHGAMIAATVVNQGRLMAPTVIDQVIDAHGRTVYRGSRQSLGQAMEPASTAVMKTLMAETIASGTCKKAFKGFRQDPVLSRLNIGGKTGSINIQDGQARVDWFVGFAEEPGSAGKIAIGAVVAHENYIGLKANHYGMIAMRHYFQSLLAGGKKALPAAATPTSG